MATDHRGNLTGNNNKAKTNAERQIKLTEVDENGKKIGFIKKIKQKNESNRMEKESRTPKKEVVKEPIVFTDAMNNRINAPMNKKEEGY
jgi:hypothetical protein